MLGSAPWSNPGGTGDFDPSPSASLTVGGPDDMPHTWLSTAALVSDVQSWLDNSTANFGWALVNNEATTQTQKIFYSRSATRNSSGVPNSLDPSWHPTLTVTYVPEPGTALLVVVSLPLLITARKR